MPFRGVRKKDLTSRLGLDFYDDNLGNVQSYPTIITLATATKWSYQRLINRYGGQLNLSVFGRVKITSKAIVDSFIEIVCDRTQAEALLGLATSLCPDPVPAIKRALKFPSDH